MKTTRISLSFFILVLLLAQFAVQAKEKPASKNSTTAAALSVDPEASSLTWKATKVGGEHYGAVAIGSGTLDVDGDILKGGVFTLNMTTITVADITNETYNKKLVGHLKSDDFFSVEKSPVSTFKITKAEPIKSAADGELNYNITGDLTIKGITNPISFPAKVSISGKKAQASADFTINRLKWDIKFHSSILGTAADKIIYDDFNIAFKVVTVK